jgi:hypothetical protein
MCPLWTHIEQEDTYIGIYRHSYICVLCGHIEKEDEPPRSVSVYIYIYIYIYIYNIAMSLSLYVCVCVCV